MKQGDGFPGVGAFQKGPVMGLAYTFAKLKQAVEHVLGGDPDTRTSKGRIVNKALDHLFSAHSWNWRVRHTTLAFTASQDRIDLPADFGSLVQLLGKAAKYTSITPVNPQYWALISVHGVPDNLSLAYMIEAQTPVSSTSTPLYTLKITPTPTATLADALLMVYRITPTTFTEDDDSTADDLKFPNVPAGPAHRALIQLCRAYARSEEEDESQEWGLANQALQQAITEDSRAAGTQLGSMTGTLVDEWYGPTVATRPHTEIYMPGDALP